MRKKSREMDAAFALEVMDKAPYITVSFTRPDGRPYGVPLSLARTDEKTFYFHGALEGEKMDCIAHSPIVALSAVTKCAPTIGPKDGSFCARRKKTIKKKDLLGFVAIFVLTEGKTPTYTFFHNWFRFSS